MSLLHCSIKLRGREKCLAAFHVLSMFESTIPPNYSGGNNNLVLKCASSAICANLLSDYALLGFHCGVATVEKNEAVPNTIRMKTTHVWLL